MNRDELVRRACEGDRVARDELGKQLYVELKSFFAQSFARDVVDELVQDVMVDIWAKAGHRAPRDADGFLAWAKSFAGTTQRAAIGERKREYARARKLEQLPEPEPARSLGSEVLIGERQELLDACLRRLPTIYRTAVRHRFDGGDDALLAEREGIELGAVRARVSRGMRMLERLVQDARRTPGPWR